MIKNIFRNLKMRFFFNLYVITTIIIFFFLILNFLLGFIWKIRTNIKFKNFEPYDEIVLESLKLNKRDGLTLYLETFINRKFDYEQFTEHAENNGNQNKFVNVTPDEGRKTTSNLICKNSVFFYGGSTTFGYNVTDFQTIPSFFGKKLIESKKSLCVKNYGRGSYFSTQENILFMKHILNKKIKEDDIIIFINGVNEGGNRNSRNTEFLYIVNNAINQKYWDMYKYTFPIFFNSLAINQFINVIKKNSTPPTRKLIQENIFAENENLVSVFQNNIDIRNGICEKKKLKCYTFLQPFGSIHGKYFNKPLKGSIENRLLDVKENFKLKKKYEDLKYTENIFDISSSLNNEKELSYVDAVHYSPVANLKIASVIYKTIFESF